MPLSLQVVLVVAATTLVVVGLGRITRAALGTGVRAYLVLACTRLVATVSMALVVGLKAEDHRAVLVFSVGAAYFAAVVLTAWRESARLGRSAPVTTSAPVTAVEDASSNALGGTR